MGDPGAAPDYPGRVIDRDDLGAWLDGPPVEEGYRKGSRLGLPAEGSGSVAPFGRRVLSLLVDWAICLLLSWALFDYSSLASLLLLAAQNVVLISLFGTTIGQLLLRVRVTPVQGRSPMILRALVRTALLLLVLPGVIWNRDLQPLHDVVAGTAVVRA